MKKILFLSAVLLGTAAVSHAGVSVHIGIPLPPLPRIVISAPAPRVVVSLPPPVVCAPAPVVVAPPVYYPPHVYLPPRPVVYGRPVIVAPRPRVVYAAPYPYHGHYRGYRR